jgi:meso-butanediol dehydrogenase/(S,S)-butanediol dehydrogenase/diacetyl reductase
MVMAERRFEGRVALVTGGTRGIGAAVVRQLVDEGARVVLAARHPEPGEALVRELGSERAVFHACDVSVQEQVGALIAVSEEKFGGLDLLINNAGVACVAATPDLDPAVWHHTLAVNLHSVFYACQAAIPLMRRRGKGSIVNIASISGLSADYGFTAYNAAKAAVINYTRALAIDHAPDNIRVNVVCPGYVETPMTALFDRLELREIWTERIPMRRAGSPEEIARVIAFVASDEASFMTGSVIVADGGLTAATGQPDLPALIKKRRSA